MNAIAPSPEETAPAERDAIDGMLCDALRDVLERHRVLPDCWFFDDIEPIAAALRADLRRSNIELVNILAPNLRRTDTVLVSVHTLALAQRNWALALLDTRVPEGLSLVAHLRQTHDTRVAELLDANNREVERRRAAEAELARIDELHPLSAWHDDDRDVLWWKLPITEPPYVGSPLCENWPGYHTHWQRIREPQTEVK